MHPRLDLVLLPTIIRPGSALMSPCAAGRYGAALAGPFLVFLVGLVIGFSAMDLNLARRR